MKRILSFILPIILFGIGVVLYFTELNQVLPNTIKTKITLTINKKEIQIEHNGKIETKRSGSEPVIVDGSAMVPIRIVSEVLGCSVDWNDKIKTARINQGAFILYLTIGSKLAILNNELIEIKQTPIILNGKTYVPIKFISQVMGKEVNWIDSEKKMEIIEYNNKQPAAVLASSNEKTKTPEDLYIKTLQTPENLSDKIRSSSYENYFTNLCYAVLLKKGKIHFEFSNNTLATECFTKTNDILDKFNLSNCYQQGFLAYASSIKLDPINPDIEFSVELSTKSLKDILGIDEILIVNNNAEFNTTILNCINNKKIFVVVLLNQFKKENYNIGETVINSMSPYSLDKGFIANGKDNQSLEAGGIKIVNYIFNYKKMNEKIEKIADTSEPSEISNFIKDEFFKKSPESIIRVNNFKDSNIDIVNIVEQVNSILLKEKNYYGYVTKLINASNCDIALIQLQTVYYNKGEVPNVTKDLNIIRNEKDFYTLMDKSLSSNLKEVTFINNGLINYEELLGTFTTQNFEFPINNIGYKEDDNKITINFEYHLSVEQMTKTREKAKEIVDQIIKVDMSDNDKIKTIHDYIINNTRFDDRLYLKNKIPDDSYTSYGVLFKNVGVCQGYAAAFNTLAKLSGIKSLCVAGKGKETDHAWNMVKIGTEIFYIDTTWDDPVSIFGGNYLVYDYFMVNKDKMMKDHTWNLNKYNEKYFDLNW